MPKFKSFVNEKFWKSYHALPVKSQQVLRFGNLLPSFYQPINCFFNVFALKSLPSGYQPGGVLCTFCR